MSHLPNPDQPEILIRRYATADKDAVWDLYNAVNRTAGLSPREGPWEDDLRDIDGAYLANRGEFVVVVAGGRLIGMGALRPLSETMGEVKRMRVDPEFRRRGIGQRIYDHLEARARVGYEKLRLDTTENLTAAIALYVKNGFAEVERRPWQDLEMIYLEKVL